jgi:hypothetical protein
MKLFVHIPKNGGMTIRKNMDIRKQVLLAQPDHHINKKYTKGLVEKMKKTQDHQGYEHAPLRYWRSDLRDQFRAVAIVP